MVKESAYQYRSSVYDPWVGKIPWRRKWQPTPLPVGYFSAFSSCLDFCVWSGLSVFWRSVVPFYRGGFTQWVELDDWLVKVSWLGKLVSVF